MRRHHLTIFILVFLLDTSLVLSAPIGRRVSPFAEYTHEVWRTREGLPQNSVNAIAQTPDGYMWFGTEEGLVQFDGVRFVLYNRRNTKAITVNHILSLCATRDSALWIGTSGGGALCLRRGEFTSYRVADGIASEYIRVIVEDTEGAVWLGTDQGLSRVYRSSVKSYNRGSGLASVWINALAIDARGDLWIASAAGLDRWSGGAIKRVLDINSTTVATSDKSIRAIMSLSTHPTNGVWVGGDRSSLTLVSPSMAIHRKVHVEAARLSVSALMRDNNGTLWFGTEDGVVGQLMGDDSTVCTTKESAPVMAMFEDREGSIWIGRAGGGLHRLRKGKFTTYTATDGLESDYVQCFHPDPHEKGSVWIGTNSGGLSRFSNGVITMVAQHEGVSQLTSNALFVDRGGTLWVGNALGLQRLQGTRLVSIVPEVGEQFGVVRGIAEDAAGCLWVTSRKGVFVSSSTKTHFRSYGDSSSRIREPVWSIYTSKKGSEIWITTVGKGLLHLVRNGDKVTRTDYTIKDGLSSNDVRSFLEDEDGTLWFGTYRGGLIRFKDGRFNPVTTENGLFDDNVFSVLEDDNGFLWMSSNLGVFRTSKKELHDFVEGRAHEVHCAVFGTADGMRTNECNGGAQFSGIKSSDGRLWFATLGGAAVIDPSRSRINDVPPPVVLESCVIDRKPVKIADVVQVGPGTGELQFTYTALSFVAPEKTRFKYRLEGFDKEWIDAGGRRVAYYTNIPPGEYTFKVIAANNDGVWNNVGASMRVSLSPHFYQTAWFYGLCIVMIGFLGSVAYHLYRNYKDREKTAERLQAQLAQAELQVLKMQLQPHFLFNTMHAISSLMHKDIEAADEMMSRLGDLLRCTLESDGAQEVELQQELETLDLYLDIEQIRLGDRLRITRDIPAELMSAFVPNLILQPLIENAIRYGVSPREEGGRVDIRIDAANNKLGVTVCDDGPGIGEQAREGVGFSNTRARLEQLYGTNQRFAYSNRADGGFCVTLEIPLRIEHHAAYRSASFQSAHTHR